MSHLHATCIDCSSNDSIVTFAWVTTSLLAAPTRESLDLIHLHHLSSMWLKVPSNSRTWKDLVIRITSCWHQPPIPNFQSSCPVAMLTDEGMAYLSTQARTCLLYFEAHSRIFPRFASYKGMGFILFRFHMDWIGWGSTTRKESFLKLLVLVALVSIFVKLLLDIFFSISAVNLPLPLANHANPTSIYFGMCVKGESLVIYLPLATYSAHYFFSFGSFL